MYKRVDLSDKCGNGAIYLSFCFVPKANWCSWLYVVAIFRSCLPQSSFRDPLTHPVVFPKRLSSSFFGKSCARSLFKAWGQEETMISKGCVVVLMVVGGGGEWVWWGRMWYELPYFQAPEVGTHDVVLTKTYSLHFRVHVLLLWNIYAIRIWQAKQVMYLQIMYLHVHVTGTYVAVFQLPFPTATHTCTCTCSNYVWTLFTVLEAIENLTVALCKCSVRNGKSKWKLVSAENLGI